MNTELLVNILLIIASIGLGLIFVFVLLFLFYVVTTLYALKRVVLKVEKNIHRIGDASKHLIDDIRDNKAFKFIFHKKPKHHKE
jgi:uncharacterized protein (DUF58 family)